MATTTTFPSDPVPIDGFGTHNLVFSTDIPHPEGSFKAKQIWSEVLEAKVDQPAMDAFWGGTMAQALGIAA